MSYHEDEARIRARAHRIWEEEGRPEGRADEHWDKARELIAMEDNQNLATRPNPVAGGGELATNTEPVEPLLAVENQGEFPDLADQGERQEYPSRIHGTDQS